jgi:hypothetical protein
MAREMNCRLFGERIPGLRVTENGNPGPRRRNPAARQQRVENTPESLPVETKHLSAAATSAGDLN